MKHQSAKIPNTQITTGIIQDRSITTARIESSDMSDAIFFGERMWAAIDEFYKKRPIRRWLYRTGFLGVDHKARSWAMARVELLSSDNTPAAQSATPAATSATDAATNATPAATRNPPTP